MNKKQKTLLWRIIIAAVFWVPLFLISEEIIPVELPKWALIILFLIRKKMKFNGELFLFYIAGYASGRFWIESLRTDQLLIMHTGIPVSMVVSAVAFAGAVLWIVIGRKRAAPPGKKK